MVGRVKIISCKTRCYSESIYRVDEAMAFCMARLTPRWAFLSWSVVTSSCSRTSKALAISASTAPRAPRLILWAISGAEIDCSQVCKYDSRSERASCLAEKSLSAFLYLIYQFLDLA